MRFVTIHGSIHLQDVVQFFAWADVKQRVNVVLCPTGEPLIPTLLRIVKKVPRMGRMGRRQSAQNALKMLTVEGLWPQRSVYGYWKVVALRERIKNEVQATLYIYGKIPMLRPGGKRGSNSSQRGQSSMGHISHNMTNHIISCVLTSLPYMTSFTTMRK